MALNKACGRGFSLIEVLVALLVLSVGLLGLAAMNTNGLRLNQAAFMRGQAAFLAYDIADRMRANRAGAQDDHYVIAHGTAAASDDDCVAAACSAEQLADYDLLAWKTALAARLPSGDGAIVEDAANPNEFTVTVRWDEERTGATGTDCPPDDDNDLRCFEVEVAL